MSETVIIALIVAIPPTIASIAALITSLKNRKKDVESRAAVKSDIRELTLKVNSRMDELLNTVRSASHAAGREELRLEQKKKKDQPEGGA
jgi:hypothetical protein